MIATSPGTRRLTSSLVRRPSRAVPLSGISGPGTTGALRPLKRPRARVRAGVAIEGSDYPEISRLSRSSASGRLAQRLDLALVRETLERARLELLHLAARDA